MHDVQASRTVGVSHLKSSLGSHERHYYHGVFAVLSCQMTGRGSHCERGCYQSAK